MNLLDYTKKLKEKIMFYDSIAQKTFWHMPNPFAKPVAVTVVWIEKDCEN